jgi:hypothetical protein
MNSPLDAKENDEDPLTLLFTSLAFFGLDEFGHAIQTPVYGSCFLP